LAWGTPLDWFYLASGPGVGGPHSYVVWGQPESTRATPPGVAELESRLKNPRWEVSERQRTGRLPGERGPRASTRGMVISWG